MAMNPDPSFQASLSLPQFIEALRNRAKNVEVARWNRRAGLNGLSVAHVFVGKEYGLIIGRRHKALSVPELSVNQATLTDRYHSWSNKSLPLTARWFLAF